MRQATPALCFESATLRCQNGCSARAISTRSPAVAATAEREPPNGWYPQWDVAHGRPHRTGRSGRLLDQPVTTRMKLAQFRYHVERPIVALSEYRAQLPATVGQEAVRCLFKACSDCGSAINSSNIDYRYSQIETIGCFRIV
jgi:hypothetical protein